MSPARRLPRTASVADMPGTIIDRYEQVPETKEDLDWAELITLDLSLFDRPGGKAELVKQLDHAVRHVGMREPADSWIPPRPPHPADAQAGFFYVKNLHISQEEVDRQFALGREFYALPLEEKLKYHSRADLDRGEYNGYRPAGQRIVGNGIKDNVQVYNIPKCTRESHPP
ncbi:hypothetical protein VTK73DRAFT_5811 [Phialemonium thermophilum]|uniref:Non-haem dioxygenase N-terminal domain-containing protein n=1 Tax=Phialemonium thermophilum TaxID=223376 RepID=A0ABR3V0F1_9PEZI